MKILVPIKSVLDYAAKIKPKADGSGVETDGIKKIVNPFDEIAVEEAIKLKEAGKAEEIIILSIGDDESVSQIRYAMAMGADRGILVKTDDYVDSDLAAKIIAKVYDQGEYGLVIMGKQAIDSDAGQTPQLIAKHLNLPHASYASKVQLEADHAVVTREVDGGLENLKINLPGVISTDLRLNEPRYAPLPGIMKAKKKQLDELSLGDLGVDYAVKTKVLKMSAPPERQAGKIVESVDQLVAALKDEAGVL